MLVEDLRSSAANRGSKGDPPIETGQVRSDWAETVHFRSLAPVRTSLLGLPDEADHLAGFQPLSGQLLTIKLPLSICVPQVQRLKFSKCHLQ